MVKYAKQFAERNGAIMAREFILNVLDDSGIKIGQAAEKLDVSRKTIKRWLGGETPNIANCRKLANLFKIPFVTVLLEVGYLDFGDLPSIKTLIRMKYDVEVPDEAIRELIARASNKTH